MESIEYKPVNGSAPDLGQNEWSKEEDYNIFIFRPSKAWWFYFFVKFFFEDMGAKIITPQAKKVVIGWIFF